MIIAQNRFSVKMAFWGNILYSRIMTKIYGRVIRGERRGGKLGFPTANITLTKKISSGVYAGKVFINGKAHDAAIYVRKEGKILEAYLLNFFDDIYEKEIAVELGKKIRNPMSFDSDKKAIRQITKDVEKIIKMLTT